MLRVRGTTDIGKSGELEGGRKNGRKGERVDAAAEVRAACRKLDRQLVPSRTLRPRLGPVFGMTEHHRTHRDTTLFVKSNR